MVLAICGFGVAGVLGAMTARDWTEDFVDPAQQAIPNDNLRNVIFPHLKDIRIEVAATAVSYKHLQFRSELYTIHRMKCCDMIGQEEV